MSKRHGLLAAAFAAGLAALAATGAPAEELKSLRGKVGLEDLNPAPPVAKQATPGAKKFRRTFAQQPPLIPHQIDGYGVTRDFNTCLSCHDRPVATKAHAPKPSAAHYTDLAGKPLKRISGTRYFCTQCHVPQADAKPLVTNRFRNAGGR